VAAFDDGRRRLGPELGPQTIGAANPRSSVILLLCTMYTPDIPDRPAGYRRYTSRTTPTTPIPPSTDLAVDLMRGQGNFRPMNAMLLGLATVWLLVPVVLAEPIWWMNARARLIQTNLRETARRPAQLALF
jgi:hypothetical protein